MRKLNTVNTEMGRLSNKPLVHELFLANFWQPKYCRGSCSHGSQSVMWEAVLGGIGSELGTKSWLMQQI